MAENDTAAGATLAEEIRSYLRKHPHAADTMEGIMRWWLSPKQTRTAPAVVKECLDNLVRRGLVSKSVLVDGTEIYSNPRSA